MKKKSSVSHAKVYVFSDSVLCLGKMSENPQSNIFWEDKLTRFESSSQYRVLDTIDGEPMGIRVEFFSGFTTFHRTDHLHVNVQRHLMGIKRQ